MFFHVSRFNIVPSGRLYNVKPHSQRDHSVFSPFETFDFLVNVGFVVPFQRLIKREEEAIWLFLDWLPITQLVSRNIKMQPFIVIIISYRFIPFKRICKVACCPRKIIKACLHINEPANEFVRSRWYFCSKYSYIQRGVHNRPRELVCMDLFSLALSEGDQWHPIISSCSGTRNKFRALQIWPLWP